jgi:hypothetical protein
LGGREPVRPLVRANAGVGQARRRRRDHQESRGSGTGAAEDTQRTINGQAQGRRPAVDVCGSPPLVERRVPRRRQNEPIGFANEHGSSLRPAGAAAPMPGARGRAISRVAGGWIGKPRKPRQFRDSAATNPVVSLIKLTGNGAVFCGRFHRPGRWFKSIHRPGC